MKRTAITAIATFALLGSSGCFDETTTWEDNPLGYLAIKLESKYKRELYRNNYSLHYTAVQPNTILITVRYYPDADVQLVYRVLREARKLVRTMAVKEFEILDIRIKTDMKKIKRPKSVF